MRCDEKGQQSAEKSIRALTIYTVSIYFIGYEKKQQTLSILIYRCISGSRDGKSRLLLDFIHTTCDSHIAAAYSTVYNRELYWERKREIVLYAQCHSTTIRFSLIVKENWEMHGHIDRINSLPLAMAAMIQSSCTDHRHRRRRCCNDNTRITAHWANGENGILHGNEMHPVYRQPQRQQQQCHRCPFIDPFAHPIITVHSTVSSTLTTTNAP